MATRIRFMRDEDPTSPRDWENLGLMACWHRRYILGDEQPSCEPNEWLEDLPEGTVVLPLYLLDHSGITMSTAAFSCPWDSGQVGYIVATPDKVWEGATREEIEKQLRAEVEVYDDYLTGTTFGYIIEEQVDPCEKCGRGDEWEHVDSCWGFFGADLEASGALDYIGTELADLAREAWDEFVGA